MGIKNILLTTLIFVRLALSCGISGSYEPSKPATKPDPEPEPAPGVESALSLPYIISDGMVLQQSSEVALFGTDDAFVQVSVAPSWTDKTFSAKTDKSGRWKVIVKTPAGSDKAWSIRISDSNGGVKTVNDVLVGEVWLCSGQSNMEHPMKGFSSSEPVKDAAKELSDADYPRFRYFKVPQAIAYSAQYNTGASSWSACSSENAKNFEAVAFFFGREIHRKTNVPVGIIGCAYGGTRIEGWMAPESFSRLAKNEYMDADKLSAGTESPSAPSNAYNAMLYPVLDYGFRGMLWFQGESNCNYYWSYSHLLQEMVSTLRDYKGDAKLPFYFAQLAPWENNKPITNDGSALLRNAQMTAYKAIPNSGIIGLGDVGSQATVHFPDKKTPGERFALWAMYNEYGDRSVNPMGPVFSSMAAEGGKLVVKLENGEGLHLAEGESSVRYAEIAGADGVFVSADVRIAGDNFLEFSSPKVTSPTQARYCFSGWHEATIFNAAGLPLFPFKANL